MYHNETSNDRMYEIFILISIFLTLLTEDRHPCLTHCFFKVDVWDKINESTKEFASITTSTIKPNTTTLANKLTATTSTRTGKPTTITSVYR